MKWMVDLTHGLIKTSHGTLKRGLWHDATVILKFIVFISDAYYIFKIYIMRMLLLDV